MKYKPKPSKSDIIKYMSKRYGTDPKYLSACYGKLRRTKKDAIEHARRYPHMNAYKCIYCHHWHMGRKKDRD